MKEKEEKRKNQPILFIMILSVITLLVAVTGATLAYFAATVHGNESASSVLIQTSSLVIEYKTLNEINEKNIKPNFEKTMNFTIENKGVNNSVVGYKIFWNVTKNNFEGNDLVYSLNGISNKNDDTIINKVDEKIPLSNSEIGLGIINPGSIQQYNLVIKFLETGIDQNKDQGKDFIGKLEVRSE